MEKYKAQLVVKDYAQSKGLDYDETFAPTAKMVTIRTVIALAAHHQWPIYQMDIKSAFLNGTLEEEVYVEQPPGFAVPGSASKVCKLKKALYGLKQAPRAWYQRIDEFFGRIGLERSPSDPNLYLYLEGGKRLILILYVNDLILTGEHTEKIS